jgi:hypothetical protein
MKYLSTMLFLLCASFAVAQGSYVAFPVQTANGVAVAGANVALCSTTQPTTVTPCGGSSVQQTYATISGTACTLNPTILGPTYGTGCTNPGMADGFGMVRWYASPNGSTSTYYYQAYGAGILVPDVEPVFFPGGATSGGVTGTGTANTFPLWTGTSTQGNSLLTPVTSPNGINYSLGGGLSIQLDVSHLSFNSDVSGSSNVTIANTYNPGSSNNSGGIILQAAPTSGSACAGTAAVKGGQEGSGTSASLSVAGNCANGFGQIGENITLTTGIGAGGNGNGEVVLNDQTGTFTQNNGAGAEAGQLSAYSLKEAGATFTASGCSNGTLVGGATAGKFTIGASGACTITITMGSSQTATHGWACAGSDQTTAAGNPIYQSGGSASTAILVSQAGATSSDVISFYCLGF